MAAITVLLALLFGVVFLVGGALSPAGLILLAAIAIGAAPGHRAKRRRGSATRAQSLVPFAATCSTVDMEEISMRLREALGVCSLLIVLPVAGAAQGGAQGASATAELKDAKGQTVGHAELQDGAKGMVIRLHLMASVPGERAIHIHQIGKCDPPTFQSAGAHLNPANVAHGILSDKGAHAGDLPNVHMAATAMTDVQLFAPGVTLATLLDSDGAALVLHAKPDDYRTDPAGNAGDRIACGTVSKR